MRGDSKGIQKLLIAEKRADDKIQGARKRKIARLKQAKDEVEAAIRKLKAEKEDEFKEYETQFLGSREEQESMINTETVNRLNDIAARVDTEKGQVIDYLLDQVLAIKPSLHQNFKFRGVPA